jgi:antitoxin YefM
VVACPYRAGVQGYKGGAHLAHLTGVGAHGYGGLNSDQLEDQRMRILPLAEAKATLSKLVTDVATTDEEVTITRNGRAAAVLVSVEEFERWRETAEVMSDPKFLAEIRRGIASLRRGRARRFRGADLDRLFGDV